jgi:DNA-binding transcriptional regulator YbjK
MLSAIKTAKHFELTSDDIIFSIATDSAEMYQSRLTELEEQKGKYSTLQAVKDHEKCVYGTKADTMKELTYNDKKAIHNLKYFTWVEQQAKEVEDLNQLWYDKKLWNNLFNQATKWDEMINEFNEEAGVLAKL